MCGLSSCSHAQPPCHSDVQVRSRSLRCPSGSILPQSSGSRSASPGGRQPKNVGEPAKTGASTGSRLSMLRVAHATASKSDHGRHRFHKDRADAWLLHPHPALPLATCRSRSGAPPKPITRGSTGSYKFRNAGELHVIPWHSKSLKTKTT